MQQIATGVETLHYLEMIHKDLKVSNILCPQLTEMRPPGYKIDLFSKLPNGNCFCLWSVCGCNWGLREHGRCSGHSVFGERLKCWTPWERTSHPRIHQQRMCTLSGWYVMSHALVTFLLKAIAWQILNWHWQAEDQSCLITWALGWPNHCASAGIWILPYCLDGASSDQSSKENLGEGSLAFLENKLLLVTNKKFVCSEEIGKLQEFQLVRWRLAPALLQKTLWPISLHFKTFGQYWRFCNSANTSWHCFKK